MRARPTLKAAVVLLATAAVLLIVLYGCQPLINPLDFPQKIDAPRYVLPCDCGDDPCARS